VNVSGGAIALGHPVGATGAILERRASIAALARAVARDASEGSRASQANPATVVVGDFLVLGYHTVSALDAGSFAGHRSSTSRAPGRRGYPEATLAQS
jgi:hypothetical protein